jgi:hypothetical protein
MSGPQGQDPNQQWSSGQPGQQPPPSEEQTAETGWQEPAYAPTQYGQPQSYPSTPQYPQQGQDFGQQPTQYGPTEQAAQQPTQYGQPGQYQPPQYGQQYSPTDAYGQPAQYTPPGVQYGEAPAYGQPDAARGSRSSMAILGSIIGVLVAIIVAVVLVMGFWKPGFFVTTKLDVNKAQQGVQQILTDQTNGYGVKKADSIKCNNGQNPTVKKGDTFSCDVSVDGQHKQVTVTFQDNSGTYEVGRPK